MRVKDLISKLQTLDQEKEIALEIEGMLLPYYTKDFVVYEDRAVKDKKYNLMLSTAYQKSCSNSQCLVIISRKRD